MTPLTTDRTGPPAMNGRSWALLFVLGGLWGGSFFLTQIVIHELPPLPLVAARLGLAALALLAGPSSNS